MNQLSLARQLDLVFTQIQKELKQMKSGTVFVQIRNNMIGKFGVRQEPFSNVDKKSDELCFGNQGLSEQQQIAFRKMAIQSLVHKEHWTHGEIEFDFMIRKGVLETSVQFESHYNMANLLGTKSQRFPLNH